MNTDIAKHQLHQLRHIFNDVRNKIPVNEEDPSPEFICTHIRRAMCTDAAVDREVYLKATDMIQKDLNGLMTFNEYVAVTHFKNRYPPFNVIMQMRAAWLDKIIEDLDERIERMSHEAA